MNNANKRNYSWLPDVPDHRDKVYTRVLKPILVKKVDIIGKWNAIEDQGSLGSCTGNCVTSMLEIKLTKDEEKKTEHLSRLMAYYNGRKIDGSTTSDAGAQLRSVIKGLVKEGVSTEKTWPYTISEFKKSPSKSAKTEGKVLADRIALKKLSYARLTSLNSMLDCLSKGNTFVFGFSVPETIDTLPKSGVLHFPKTDTKIDGGHAVLAVGYDITKEFIWVRNSWGESWGLKGYFKMPFQWFTDSRRLVDDVWTLQ